MKRLFLLALLATFTVSLSAQEENISDIFVQKSSADALNEDGSFQKYRRSSLYSVLIAHTEFKYGDIIQTTFYSIPTNEKFNNHDLEVKSIASSARKMKKKGKEKARINGEDIERFLNEYDVARKMVAKWFNRNPKTGGFNLDLMLERGYYDAQQVDIDQARQTLRNVQSLGDAGAELIGKTFLLVNDITFVDKGERSRTIGGIFRALGEIAGAITENSAARDLGNIAGEVAEEVDGFRVNITSYLYRLDWNEEVEATFWQELWYDENTVDEARRAAFDSTDIFKMVYVGETTTSAANLASRSFSSRSKEEQMLTVCTRAIDKSIVELQREYDEFKVSVPIGAINTKERTVQVPIGLKEGINERSQFDVLLKVEGADGRFTYEKVGRIQPIKGMIWDNRFGALDEAQIRAEEGLKEENPDESGDATLTATTFRILDGANRIMPGCLVREVTIKRKK